MEEIIIFCLYFTRKELLEKREQLRQAKRLAQQKRTAEKKALQEMILIKAKEENAFHAQEERRIKVGFIK